MKAQTIEKRPSCTQKELEKNHLGNDEKGREKHRERTRKDNAKGNNGNNR